MGKAFLLVIILLCIAGAHAAIVPITQCGILNTPSTTYVLQNDVSAPGTCFSIQADDITLDLNGKTVNYNTGGIVSVPNADFEQGTTEWDLSAAPNAAVLAGTYVAPVTVANGNSALAWTLPATPQSIKSQPVTLEGGKTYVIYARFMTGVPSVNSATQYIQIEDATTGAVLGKTTMVGNSWRGFNPNTITYKPTTSTSIRIVLGIEGNLANYTDDKGVHNFAGQKMYADEVRVQTAGSHGVIACPTWTFIGERYDNACGGSASRFTLLNGIMKQVSPGFASSSIQIAQIGGTHNITIHDVTTYVQGPNSANIYSNGAHNGYNIYNNRFYSNVTTLVSRDNLHAVQIQLTETLNSVFHDNIVNGGPHGAVLISSPAGQSGFNKVYGNDISQNGRVTNDFGIYAWSDSVEVYNNYVHPTSGRGIQLNNNGARVYNNNVETIELKQNQEYNGCQTGGTYGIQIETNALNSNVYGNTVTARAGDCDGRALRITDENDWNEAIVETNLTNNFTASSLYYYQAWSNFEIFSSQITVDRYDGNGALINRTTYPTSTARFNTIKFTAGPTTKKIIITTVFAGGLKEFSQTFLADSTAASSKQLRYDMSPRIYNNNIFNNTFKAVKTGAGNALGISFGSVNGTTITIKDNVFEADSAIIDIPYDGGHTILFNNNIFRKGATPASNFVTVKFASSPYSGGNIFRDTRVQNGVDLMSASGFLTGLNGAKGPNGWEGFEEYFVQWTLDLTVLNTQQAPLPGATVTIKDATSSVVFTGNTDATGKVSAPLTQFREYNSNLKTVNYEYKTPHTVTVSYAGATVSSPVTMDAQKSVTISLDGTVVQNTTNITTSPPPNTTNTTPPPVVKTIAFTQPTNSSEIKGNATLVLQPSDASLITQTSIYRDGSLLTTLPAGSFSVLWNTFAELNGQHLLNAVATFIDGSTSSSQITVVVNNTNPTGSIIVSGKISSKGKVCSNCPVVVTLAGVAKTTTTDNLGRFSVTFNMALPPGSYTITIAVTDPATGKTSVTTKRINI
jgi:hypothetical protein